MTAFARGQSESKWGGLTWELRSVNHRFLEISMRLPDEQRAFEPKFRETINARLKRGRIDAVLRFRGTERVDDSLQLDEAAVARLVDVAGRVQGAFGDLAGLRTIDVLRWPGVLITEDVDTDGLAADALALLNTTLDELCASRGREGGQLKQTILQRLDSIDEIVTRVRQCLPDATDAFRKRLDERLLEIRDKVDPTRVEQEVVLFMQRTDVDEELDRLVVHVEEVRRVVDESHPVGRRLDFMMQELNREANTLGSKAVDTRVTAASVDLKVLVEQIREQVQNIE